jgi:HK97 family phage major capsid protein
MDLIKQMRERRAAVKARLDALGAEARALTDVENTEFDAGLDELRSFDERITELQAAEARSALASALHVELGTGGSSAVVTEPNPVYRRNSAETSFFKDTFNAQNKGDQDARGRLAASQETRAGDLTTVAGAGGQFAPPLWITQDFVELARASRVTADLMNHDVLPEGVSSINLPTVTGGTAVGVQATQNTGVQDTAATTGSVSSGITTIAGQQIVSNQLLKQSGIPFDRLILGDLARDYAGKLNVQVISGSGAGGNLRGLLNGAGVGATTYTTISPKVTDGATPANSFYNKIISAIANVSTNRFLPPTAIVMTPIRWGWLVEALDSTGRPLITINTPSFNAVGSADAHPVAQGPVGSIAGLPVYLDALIPQNLGAGANEDRVFVIRQDDCWLYESAIESASFDATYASQMSILFRVSGYSAFIPDRYGKSVNVIAGTGLIVPSL